MFESLKKGNCVQNPVFWKRVQSLLNFIFGCGGLLVLVFPSLQNVLTPEVLVALTSVITASNVYFTHSTTESIGL